MHCLSQEMVETNTMYSPWVVYVTLNETQTQITRNSWRQLNNFLEEGLVKQTNWFDARALVQNNAWTRNEQCSTNLDWREPQRLIFCVVFFESKAVIT